MQQYFKISALSGMTSIICIITAGLISNSSEVLYCSDYQRYGYIPPVVRELFDQLLALLILKGVIKFGYLIFAALIFFPSIGILTQVLKSSTMVNIEKHLITVVQRYLRCYLSAAFAALLMSLFELCVVMHEKGGLLMGLACGCASKVPQYAELALVGLALFDISWACFGYYRRHLPLNIRSLIQ
jgi:hypothetical protein